MLDAETTERCSVLNGVSRFSPVRTLAICSNRACFWCCVSGDHSSHCCLSDRGSQGNSQKSIREAYSYIPVIPFWNLFARGSQGCENLRGQVRSPRSDFALSSAILGCDMRYCIGQREGASRAFLEQRQSNPHSSFAVWRALGCDGQYDIRQLLLYSREGHFTLSDPKSPLSVP